MSFQSLPHDEEAGETLDTPTSVVYDGRMNDFNPLEPEFVSWGKIPRLFRDVVITEKLDGTNAAIGILDDGRVYAQSRKKLITPEQDNAGFARWVSENEGALREGLGFGLHFGEFWGRGIQCGYGMDGKRFSLFNTARWGDVFATTDKGDLVGCSDAVAELDGAGVRVVPVLYHGPFSEYAIKTSLENLADHGSVAAPGWMDPEGVIVFHTAGNSMWKITIKDDEKPKGSNE